MQQTQSIHCPNCGSRASRREGNEAGDRGHACPGDRVMRIECPACDYFFVACSLNGNVIEAYAPGLWMRSVRAIESSHPRAIPAA